MTRAFISCLVGGLVVIGMGAATHATAHQPQAEGVRPRPAPQAQSPAPPAAAQPRAEPQVSLSDLETAVERNPGDARLLVILGVAFLNRNDDVRALETLQRAVRAAPESAEAHNWLGVALAAKEDVAGAVAAFRKAVALDPQYGCACLIGLPPWFKAASSRKPQRSLKPR